MLNFYYLIEQFQGGCCSYLFWNRIHHPGRLWWFSWSPLVCGRFADVPRLSTHSALVGVNMRRLQLHIRQEKDSSESHERTHTVRGTIKILVHSQIKLVPIRPSSGSANWPTRQALAGGHTRALGRIISVVFKSPGCVGGSVCHFLVTEC